MSVMSARTKKKTPAVTITATQTRGGGRKFRVRARGAGAPDLRSVVPGLVGTLGGGGAGWCPNSGTYASLAERTGHDDGRAGCGHCGRTLKLRRNNVLPHHRPRPAGARRRP